MANFKSTYFVIECESGEEFISGGNSKTNGLYSSKSKAVHHIKDMIKCYEKQIGYPRCTERGREICLAEIERYKAMKITEVQIVKV